jgi:hypothetical protein
MSDHQHSPTGTCCADHAASAPLPAEARDPVCGMMAKTDGSKPTSRVDDRDFFFSFIFVNFKKFLFRNHGEFWLLHYFSPDGSFCFSNQFAARFNSS